MAIDAEKARPKIRHTDVSKEMRTFRGVFKEFIKEVEARFEAKALEGKKGWNQTFEKVAHRGEWLLNLRKQLLWAAKEGMQGKKDKEVDIALRAFFVWFARKDFEEQIRILKDEMW